MPETKSKMTPKEWMAFYDQLFQEREPVISPPRSKEEGAPDICPIPLPRDLGAATGQPEGIKE